MVTSVHFNSSRFFAISHFLEGVSKMRGRDLFFFSFFLQKAVLGLGLCKWRSWETPLEAFTAPVGRAPAALFLLTGILITFLCIRVNVCLIVVFIITILDLSINFYKVGTLDCTYFYPVLQCILYCNIRMFKTLVFIIITYYSLA